MKRKKILCLLAPIIGFATIAAGCSWGSVSVTSIEKTASYEYEDVYTVNYSDGTSSTFTVQHGKDATAQELFDRYKEEYGDDLTYEEFLTKYMTVQYNLSSSVVGEGLLSSFIVNAENLYSAATGSAVLYAINEDKNDAYILTNYHVTYINSSYGSGVATSITCSLYGSEQTSFRCTYIGGSVNSDIALLKTSLSNLRAVNEDVKPVTLASGYSVGETVYAIGNTEGNGISATQGIVSVDSEEVNMTVDGKNQRTHRVMRIDAAIYHGNSGGGLFNANGELIGITNGGNETDQNINYAIPISIVKGTADNILHYYEDGDSSTNGAYKIMLGVNVKTQNARFIFDGKTGYIKEDIVATNVSSIASSLGLKAYDILTGIRINDNLFPLNRSYDIYDALLTARAGDEIKVEYVRSGTAQTSSAYTIKQSDLSAF